MKKAIISLGNKQYLVKENQELVVEKVTDSAATKLEPLLVIDDDKILIGQPTLKKPQVEITVLDHEKGDKVTAIRYKAKKRVHKTRGHRQDLTRIKISKIA